MKNCKLARTQFTSHSLFLGKLLAKFGGKSKRESPLDPANGKSNSGEQYGNLRLILSSRSRKQSV